MSISTKSRPFVTSTLAATVVSMVAAWSVVSFAFPPLAPLDRQTVTHTKPSHSSSGHHFYISPLPPGADWTSS